MREFKIKRKEASEIEQYLKKVSTRTTLDSNSNVKYELNPLSTYYVCYYEKGVLSKIRVVNNITGDEHMLVVAEEKHITLYGLKFTYSLKDEAIRIKTFIDHVNEYIENFDANLCELISEVRQLNEDGIIEELQEEYMDEIIDLKLEIL